METETVKGFKDFIGEDAEKREEIRKVLVEIFEKYGFEPAETPVVEYEEFVRGDNANDEAVSDIFKLEDKGKRKLALRYEFTFQLKRLMKNKKLPYKRFQIGYVFRDEPVSANRFRQITQCDIDTIGSTIKDEAEVLTVVKEVLNELGIEFEIFVNNRKLLNEIMEKENIEKMDREKIIKEIDKMDKLDEDEVYNNLRGYNAQGLLEIFKKPESFFEKYESYKEIKELQEYCKYYGTKIIFLPSLARGLSYYNASVFEVRTKKIKETITGGGSYMFNGVQCTGLSFGLERLSMLAKIKSEKEKIMVLSISEDEEAIKIMEKLRKSGKNCIFFSGKPTKALDYANSRRVKEVYFVGNE
jgi:histidyl-tRNA synthetase